MEPEFDVAALIAALDRWASSSRHAAGRSGRLKVYRWRMRGAREHARKSMTSGNAQVGEDQARIDIDCDPHHPHGPGRIPSWRRLYRRQTAGPKLSSGPASADQQ